MNKPDHIPEKFAGLITPKPGAKMTTRSPRKAAGVFKALALGLAKRNGKGSA